MAALVVYPQSKSVVMYPQMSNPMQVNPRASMPSVVMVEIVEVDKGVKISSRRFVLIVIVAAVVVAVAYFCMVESALRPDLLMDGTACM